MRGRNTWWPALMALWALTCSGGHLLAGDLYNKEPAKPDIVALPQPTEVRSLTIAPTTIALKGSDDAHQLVVTAALADGRLQDLTGDVKYESADSRVARVSSAGRVVPVANGRTEITAAYGDRVVKVPVQASAQDENLPINF